MFLICSKNWLEGIPAGVSALCWHICLYRNHVIFLIKRIRLTFGGYVLLYSLVMVLVNVEVNEPTRNDDKGQQ